MSWAVTIVAPLVIWLVATKLARRELALYALAKTGDRDLFVYSPWRLWRRMTGVAVLVALGATLAALGVFPPRTAAEATSYIGVLVGEVLVLFVLPVWDLVETVRTARPGRGIRHGGRTRPKGPR